jgi:two-component system CheB/CheR fusion protein
MLVEELISARDEKWDVKIFASDLDKFSIEHASRGIYPKGIAADVPAGLLARFFAEDNGSLRISPEIRRQVVFARQNILRDPPFTKVDLISCRNLLIYLRTEAQKKVMALLYFALQPDGYLILGTSETIGDWEDAFETVNAKTRIFKKRHDSTHSIAAAISGLPRATRASNGGHGLTSVEIGYPDKKRQQKIWETVSERLMAEFGTTCLVLNANYEILYSFGEPQRFLTVHPGEASLRILKLVARPLSLALSSALRRAAKERQTVRYSDIRLSEERGAAMIDLKVEPLTKESDDAGTMLVFFRETKAARGARKAEKFNPSSESIGRIADLENDLESTKESLQAATEDKETAQEELQATNEELLAGNEELQSSNEELESVNEELTTLNAEYQQKIAELIVSNNDLENFLRTSDIATIFLDEALRLRRFTPAVTREIPLRQHDLGRLLSEFAHPLIDAITVDAASVAAGGQSIMKTIETRPGVWHLINVTPYRREGASDHGVVISILDVSALHQMDRPLGAPKSSGK